MKTQQIRVDRDVMREIEKHWQPRDTPNTILRRLLGLDKKAESQKEEVRRC